MEGRLLWLTDTWNDRNGVSVVLRSIHEEIKKRNLPVDILICGNNDEADDHLIVVKSQANLTIPFYRHQQLRIPDFREIKKAFVKGKYSMVISSTEGPMGVAALYLKKIFRVRTYFYLHTDWVMFARKALRLNQSGTRLVSKLLRKYYMRYDGIFVLNKEQRNWLSSREYNLKTPGVFLTAHWVDEVFKPKQDRRVELFGVSAKSKIMLFAGRLSREKGVMELPIIYERLKGRIPDLKIVFAGAGPVEKDLRTLIPDAIFLGWTDHDKLPDVYSSADILVLPSIFDTFSCVILEAISCGLPVIAYNVKGPAEILEDKISGFLVTDPEEMTERLYHFFSDPGIKTTMSEAALNRSHAFTADSILNEFILNAGLFQEHNEPILAAG